jgi:uncharacterized LabA/DUF88 family protein
MPNRVAVFIDGMNTRHFLRSTGRDEFVDVKYLAEVLAEPDALVSCDYFVGRPEEAHLGAERSQKEIAYYTKVEAQGPLVTVHYGFWTRRPSNVQTNWGDVRIRRWVEKQVDVLIASEMISKAVQGTFDTALLLCADADLVPAIKVVKTLCKKRIRAVIFAKPYNVPRRNWPVMQTLLDVTDRPALTIMEFWERPFRRLVF